MPTYILLSSLTPEGRRTLHSDPDRLEQVNKEISRLLTLLTTLRSEIGSVDQDYALAAEAVKNGSREYQSASVTVNSKSQDMKQIAPALVPERPVRPKILPNTIAGFLLGP